MRDLWGLALILGPLLSLPVWASPDSCEPAELARAIVSLYSEDAVGRVEEINREQADALAKYTHGATVESELRASRRFGFVAVEKGEIVGFVVAERRASHFAIVNIAVAKGSERQGIGRDLIARVVTNAEQTSGIDDVRIVIAMNDSVSTQFFTRLGFTPAEIIPAKFENRTISALLMKRGIRVQPTNVYQPQLQRAPAPAPRPSTLVRTIDVDERDLAELDPILRQSRDAMQSDD